jgi:hypothetical protein
MPLFLLYFSHGNLDCEVRLWIKRCIANCDKKNSFERERQPFNKFVGGSNLGGLAYNHPATCKQNLLLEFSRM